MGARRWAIWPRRRDIDTPAGINIGIGAVTMVAATTGAAWVPVTDPAARCAFVAAAVGAFAVATVDPWALTGIVPMAWMVMNGFLVNQTGELTWHGPSDAYRFLALAGAAAAGLAAGAADRSVRDLRERRRMGALASAWATEAVMKEKKQRA